MDALLVFWMVEFPVESILPSYFWPRSRWRQRFAEGGGSSMPIK